MLLFSNLSKPFFGYFDPENIFLEIVKLDIFRVELTDVFAIKEAPRMTSRCPNTGQTLVPSCASVEHPTLTSKDQLLLLYGVDMLVL